MQAVILAAGMGTRLGALTTASAKCMVQLHGRRLIERLLDTLAHLRLRRAVLVVGHGADELRATLGDEHRGLPIAYVLNPHYRSTNNIYSLALAADELCADDTLLIESDLVLDRRILHACINQAGSAAAVAPCAPWMDGTATQLDPEGFISRFVPKGAYDPADSRYFKTVNLYRLERGFCAARLVPELHAHIERVGAHVYYEEVLGRLVERGHAQIKAVVVDALPWYEIDTPADLRAAEALFRHSPDESSS